MKVRQNGRVVSLATIIAVGVNADGRREVLDMDVGPSEAESFWTEFLRKLRRRGLCGVKLVVSDAHEGLKAAVSKVLQSSWQRCRVHFMRILLGPRGRAEVAAGQFRRKADRLGPSFAFSRSTKPTPAKRLRQCSGPRRMDRCSGATRVRRLAELF